MNKLIYDFLDWILFRKSVDVEVVDEVIGCCCSNLELAQKLLIELILHYLLDVVDVFFDFDLQGEVLFGYTWRQRVFDVLEIVVSMSYLCLVWFLELLVLRFALRRISDLAHLLLFD